ncbi:MAG: hypothetical protein ACRDV7_13890 [Acidimicrobiia bacterium]
MMVSTLASIWHWDDAPILPSALSSWKLKAADSALRELGFTKRLFPVSNEDATGHQDCLLLRAAEIQIAR